MDAALLWKDQLRLHQLDDSFLVCVMQDPHHAGAATFISWLERALCAWAPALQQGAACAHPCHVACKTQAKCAGHDALSPLAAGPANSSALPSDTRHLVSSMVEHIKTLHLIVEDAIRSQGKFDLLLATP